MKKLLLAFGLLSTFLSVSANQDPQINYSLNNYAQTGAFAGLHAGYGFGRNGLLKTLPHESTPEGKSANIMGGFILGYDVALNDNLNLGLQSGVNAYPNIATGHILATHGNQVEHKISIYNVPILVTAKLFIPNAEGVNFFGEAGYAFNYLEVKNCDNDYHTDWSPTVGAGVGYKIKNVNIFIKYQYNWMQYDKRENNYAAVSGGFTYALPF